MTILRQWRDLLESELMGIVSCVCFTMTGNGPRATEFPVMLKQAHNRLDQFPNFI